MKRHEKSIEGERQVTAFLRFDFHVVATLLLRGWSIIAGAVTVLGIPFWLSPVEQGYYFTFASILASQIFFELGFNYVLTQFAASEMKNLRWSSRGFLVGPIEAKAKLGSLVDLSTHVYTYLAVAFAVVTAASGWLFFNSSPEPHPSQWRLAWLLAVLSTAGNLFVSPRLALVEGIGKVGQIAQLRTRLSVLGYLAAWAALASGFGLLAIPIISGTQFIGSCIWQVRYGKFLAVLRRYSKRNAGHRISWREEILPLQWRIGVSWASGYLIFQLFNPILFSNFGAQEAGRVGLILAVCSALVTLSLSWVSAKVPLIVQKLRAGQIAEGRALYLSQFKSSSLCFLVLGFCLVVAVLVLQQVPAARDRLPTTATVLWIVVASFSNQLVFSLAVYMRAYGVEPLMWPSVITAAATVVALSTFGRYSVEAAMAGYALVQLIICLPWVVYIFRTGFWRKSSEQ